MSWNTDTHRNIIKKVAVVMSLSVLVHAANASDINISKKFNPDARKELETTTVELTLTNENLNFDALNAAVTDTLPAGMSIATPLNVVTSNCGASVSVTAPTTNQVTITGAQINKFTSTPTPCIVRFDVVAPKLAAGASQANYINDIATGDLTADIDGTSIVNETSATATLTVKKNEVEVAHGFYLDGVSTEMTTGRYFNEGEDLYLVTTITNPSFVQLTGVNFANDFANNVVNGIPGSATTTCGGTVVLNKATPSTARDQVTLTGGTIPPNSSCEVRVKIDRTTSEFQYRNLNTYDTVVAGAVTTDEGFANTNADSASVRAIGGPRVYKYFCTGAGSGCARSLTVPTTSGTVERYVRLQLINNNTNGSPFRSVFTDQLPAGMTLAADPDISITPTTTCSAVTATGTAGSSSIAIDATNMPPASATNSTSAQNSQCFVNAKVVFDATTDGTEYQNTLFAGNRPTGSPVTSPVNSYDWTINGGHTDDTNGGFSPYVQTSELVIEDPEDFSIRKDFSTLDVRAGHEFTMTLTLTNASASPITNVNIADDLATMRYGSSEPVIFSQGENGTAVATTTCPAGSVGSYVTGDQQLNFTGLTVPANGSCTVTVPLIVDSSFPIRPSSYAAMTNTIQGNDVSYTAGGVTSTLDENISDYVRVRWRYYRSKVFTPDEIKAGGSSRINIRVYIYGGAVSDLVNLNINDNLPTGMTLADNPDASFTCDRATPVGVTLNATAGSSTLGVTVGSIPKTALNVNNNCYLRATVKTDPSYTSSTMTNTATVTAQEGAGPLQDASGEVIESYYGPLTDTIKVDSLAQLAVNKTVSIEDVGVGGTVRAIITMDNTLPNAINLTEVTLTDDLRVSGSSELLVVDPANATFGEDATGTQTTCTGGTFSVNAARTAITLSNANIPAGSVCIFAFDMTSQTGGTWTNAIPAESLSSFEGITNPSATQKAVSFSGNLVIGSKKSVTSFVNNGNGTYTVSYELGVKNFSVFPLQGVEVIDDLSSEFGTVGTDYTVSTAPSISSATTGASLTLNAAYDGDSTSQLASGGVLPVDGEVLVTFAVTFTPRRGQFSFDNTAKVSGESAGGTVTSDDSNDGDYTTPNSANPTADNVPTTVDVPQIGVTKSAATITNNNDGTFTADYTVKVRNYGGVALDNVVLTDSLATEFAGTDYSVSTAPAITSGTGLTLTAGYNGNAQSELATGSLALNAEVTITFSVTFTPVANKTTYNNQASATGVSRDNPSFSTSDQSNDRDYEDTSSTSTTDNGDPTDDNVPTPVVVNPKTLLGLAKAASVAMAENDANGVPTGNFTTDITIIAQNMGDEDLINVAITDSLINNAATGTGFGTTAVTGSPSNAGEFVVSNVFVANGTGANFVLTAGYNGASQSEIATATMLPRASQATFTFTITWRPESGKTQYTNQTSGTSTGEVTGDTAEDDSDNGTTPDGDGNGNPTNDSDPTPTTITTTPRIGIAKSATALTPVGSSGAFTTTMTLTVKNYGNEALKDVTVTDALDNTTTGFGVYVVDVASVTSAGQYTVTTELPASSPLTLNPSYTGSGSNTQLISSGALAIGEMTTVTLTITFMPDLADNRYDYENTAVAAAKGDISDSNTTDDSVDGTNPDSNGDNNPDEQSPTEVSVTPEPVIGIAKQATTVDNNDGTFTTTMALAIENLGNEALNDVNITDNLSTEFGTYVATPTDLTAAGQYTVSNISATGLTKETTFTGRGTTETAATGTLAIAATASVTFDVTYNPAKANYVNQATASATGNASTTQTTDNSDNGTNVDADGDGDPTESDEDDPTPISITPQPVIGSAKTAGTVASNGDGTFSVPYTVLVENIGNENLTNVVLVDDLTTAFGTNDNSVSADGSYSVTDFAASGDTTNIVTNTAYTGATGNDNLINSGTLAVGESVTITFTVTFRPASNTETEFDNQVTANAEGNASGTVTTDLSNDGGVIDTDGNGIANETVGTGDEGDNKVTTIKINRLPEAVDDTYTVESGSSVTLAPLTGDSDADGDTLSIVSINGTDLTPGTAQTITVPNGTVNVSATGEITFTPDANFTGSVTFPYVITDGKDNATANEIITVNDKPNTKPTAVDDNYTVDSGETVTLNPINGDSDPEGDTLTVASINGTDLTPGTAQAITAPNGIVKVSTTGEITFTPNVGFTGSVTFPYVITDGKDTATANEIITVNGRTNNPPLAADDNYSTVSSDSAVTLNPLDGDSDPDGDTLSIVSINSVDLTPGTPQTIPVPNGTVSVSATGVITFTPNAGFTGDVTFPYVITDGNQTATANEIIRVTPVEKPTQKIPSTSLWSLLALLLSLVWISSRRHEKR